MNFRLSDLKIDKILGVDFIDKTTNQVVGHWPNIFNDASPKTIKEESVNDGEWFKTAEELPGKNLLVEVKSDYFLSNGKNYAALVDTEHGMNWLCFISDLTDNRTIIIPFEYFSDWRWVETEEMSEVKKIIKEHYNEARCGLFFCKNMTGDIMDTIYYKNGIRIDICYRDEYFEVFGLDLPQQLKLKIFYDALKEEHRKENTNE